MGLSIRTGTWDDEPRIGALLALSFAADPFVRWLMPDAQKMIEDSSRHPRRAYAPAFDLGTVHILGDFAGAAMWLPPGAESDRSEEIAAAEDTVAPTFPREFPELLHRSEAYRPATPHWYLGLIAVDPVHRGKGHGTRLLEHGLALCDRDGLPAYLESTNAANLTVYKRAGFELLDEVQVGTSPKRYPMLRPARDK
ncbi:MAG: GNAT family N-acetyltransferase [Paracoccaceae bacterium]|nr:GNAT family N-acetyltransferase [Paracoccaceae bacterium]